jgi:hypothetical protein
LIINSTHFSKSVVLIPVSFSAYISDLLQKSMPDRAARCSGSLKFRLTIGRYLDTQQAARSPSRNTPAIQSRSYSTLYFLGQALLSIYKIVNPQVKQIIAVVPKATVVQN